MLFKLIDTNFQTYFVFMWRKLPFLPFFVITAAVGGGGGTKAMQAAWEEICAEIVEGGCRTLATCNYRIIQLMINMHNQIIKVQSGRGTNVRPSVILTRSRWFISLLPPKNGVCIVMYSYWILRIPDNISKCVWQKNIRINCWHFQG